MPTKNKPPRPSEDLRIKTSPEKLAKAMFQPTPKKG